MNPLEEITALPMSSSVLRQAINSGIRECAKSENGIHTNIEPTPREDTNTQAEENMQNNSQIDIFVAADTIFEFIDPPITIADVADDGTTKIENAELVPLAKHLVKIQETLGSNLRSIVGGARPGVYPSDVEIIAETPDHYILHDHEHIVTKGLNEECGVTHTTLKAHTIAVAKLLDRLRVDSPDGTAPRWIVVKPSHWYDGQWSIVQTIQELIQIGLTPTETLDYLIISVIGIPVAYWSEIRDTSESTLRNRVRTANEKLETQAKQEIVSDSKYEYFSRTYTSRIVDNKELITADNGFLHPRRDIIDSSVTGNMISGYSGAGSKQLATAILADAFNQEAALKWSQKLNGQVHKIADSNEDDGWTLSEEDLLRWVLTNTK